MENLEISSIGSVSSLSSGSETENSGFLLPIKPQMLGTPWQCNSCSSRKGHRQVIQRLKLNNSNLIEADPSFKSYVLNASILCTVNARNPGNQNQESTKIRTCSCQDFRPLLAFKIRTMKSLKSRLASLEDLIYIFLILKIATLARGQFQSLNYEPLGVQKITRCPQSGLVWIADIHCKTKDGNPDEILLNNIVIASLSSFAPNLFNIILEKTFIILKKQLKTEPWWLSGLMC